MIDAEDEIWKDVLGYNGKYKISNRGRIRGSFLSRCLWPRENHAGYLSIELLMNDRKKPHFIHNLVAEAFIGPKPSGMTTNHKDGNKKNNYPENLEYLSLGDNLRYSYEVLSLKKRSGRKGKCYVLTSAQIEKVREEIQKGDKSFRKIGRMFGVHYMTIIRVGKGELNAG